MSTLKFEVGTSRLLRSNNSWIGVRGSKKGTLIPGKCILPASIAAAVLRDTLQNMLLYI